MEPIGIPGKRDDKIISTNYDDRRNLGDLFVEFLKTRVKIPTKLLTDELDNTDGKYTQEILQQIKLQPDVEIAQLIGLDGFIHLRKKLSDDDFKKEKFIVIKRPGYELPENIAFGDNATILNEMTQDISSTQIRGKVQNRDETYKELVPESIAAYIVEHNLYR